MNKSYACDTISDQHDGKFRIFSAMDQHCRVVLLLFVLNQSKLKNVFINKVAVTVNWCSKFDSNVVENACFGVPFSPRRERLESQKHSAQSNNAVMTTIKLLNVRYNHFQFPACLIAFCNFARINMFSEYSLTAAINIKNSGKNVDCLFSSLFRYKKRKPITRNLTKDLNWIVHVFYVHIYFSYQLDHVSPSLFNPIYTHTTRMEHRQWGEKRKNYAMHISDDENRLCHIDLIENDYLW